MELVWRSEGLADLASLLWKVSRLSVIFAKALELVRVEGARVKSELAETTLVPCRYQVEQGWNHAVPAGTQCFLKTCRPRTGRRASPQ